MQYLYKIVVFRILISLTRYLIFNFFGKFKALHGPEDKKISNVTVYETGKTGLGRLDPPIDQFIRMTNNAKGKATFLKECPLLQGKNKSKWQDDDMHDKVMKLLQSGSIGGGGKSNTVPHIASALRNLEKVKVKDLKKSDRDTQTKLKQVQKLVKNYLDKWK